ncbi:Kir protein [Plasmodium coatneyi]|uniref:Kir protein n=1 Tax=Plasmodium coatneyi TaxID=208452 RepID=A0A1B1E802_9APIC|nr:Kir protein [Plasmodium coatneyi]ANQ11125.1 Kir protein [Plasmodium coatneyi]
MAPQTQLQSLEEIRDETPSVKKYDEFEDESNGCTKYGSMYNKEEIVQKLKRTVGKTYGINDNDTIGAIADAHCYACNEGEKAKTGEYYDYCHFLYFWIGEKIKEHLNDHELRNVMQTLYGNLSSESCNNGCKNLYPDMSTSIFDQRKKVFDFSYNYYTLKKSSEDNMEVCSPECGTYLQSVKSAYSSEKSSCVDATADPYCNELTAEYKNYFDGSGKPKLTCTTSPENEEESESCPAELEQVFSDAVPTYEDGKSLTEEHFKKLPSKILYQKFEDNSRQVHCDSSDVAGVTAALQSTLSGKGVEFSDTDVKKIFHAWCYVTGTVKKKCASLYQDRFKFFYLWFGEMIFKKKERIYSFDELMDEIKDGLNKMGGEGGDKCGPLCKGDVNDKTTFNRRKLAYEYYTIYKHIKEHWNEHQYKCDKAYSTYLKETYEAWDAVRQQCSGKKDKGYCDEFNENYKEHNGQELSKLECTVEHRIDTARTKTHEGFPVEGGGPATIGPIVSSALGIGGGLASIALLLYKYDLLPPGIKNTFFGGRSRNSNKRRNRRSTNSNFSTFTENDSTTQYSTEASTLGSMEEDNSTIYNGKRPPRGGNNNNNRRRGHENGKNISYQNM